MRKAVKTLAGITGNHPGRSGNICVQWLPATMVRNGTVFDRRIDFTGHGSWSSGSVSRKFPVGISDS